MGLLEPYRLTAGMLTCREDIHSSRGSVGSRPTQPPALCRDMPACQKPRSHSDKSLQVPPLKARCWTLSHHVSCRKLAILNS